uniref:T-lymphoma invasion and metastasis-inducing protein 1 n=1 Tax=Strigamia maritima TaxID=126957 RepID=T1ITC4_STRMM
MTTVSSSRARLRLVLAVFGAGALRRSCLETRPRLRRLLVRSRDTSLNASSLLGRAGFGYRARETLQGSIGGRLMNAGGLFSIVSSRCAVPRILPTAPCRASSGFDGRGDVCSLRLDCRHSAIITGISDDDRISLTTAVSDEDDVEDSLHNSPYKSRSSSSATSAFNCTGAVRKAGFLSVKKWLLRKKHQVELARKRGWKGYWVCLKGTTLLFYPCDNRDGRAIDNTPKHLIIVDGAIMQPIPEHPKREYIFCLSTAFGDAYLFQAPCQVELENWVNSIHSACAAAFARHRGKTGTLHLLQEEIYRLEKEIESDNKMKHMADLQLTVVSDADNRQSIVNQITGWEENLERLHCEQFRLRCYMASLQNSELPNPKNLLSHVSRNTKTTLNRLGVFTVSSFHAFVCARSPSLLNNLLAGRGATKRRAPAILSRSNSGSRRSLSIGGGTGDLASITEKMVKVYLPDNQTTSVYVRDNMTVEEFLLIACSKKQLLASDHFVRLRRNQDSDDCYVPHRNDLIENHTYESAEICAKILYQVELSRSTLDQMWGFSVEAELVENADRQDELCVMVSRVEDRSLAMQQGIIKGDEIMVINGAIVSDLDMMYIESVLQEELLLCMMMRSCRTEPPDFVNIMKTTDEFIEQLVCPPPPSDSALSEEMITAQEKVSPDMDSMPLTTSSQEIHPKHSSEQIENLLKLRPAVYHSSPSLFSLYAECHPLTAEQVTEYCRSPMLERRKSSGTPPPPSSTGMTPATSATLLPIAPTRQLTDAEKLRKVISELVDTEKTYVEHLNNLLENYLEPLKQETFLSSAEISALFGNIQEIVAFQRVFLLSLEKAIRKEVDLDNFTQPKQYKNVIIALADSFLRYANHFKLYSSFCASHSKAQKVLHPRRFSGEGNQMLREFLQARNPRQQHSSTLESYLIKPIQRILKYPLLLQQMKHFTEPNSEEHLKLAGALKEMEKVAEHINEMQRIHEEYGAIFDHLYRQHLKSSKQHVDLSPGELLYYGGVEWLNISDFLGKIKKGLELHAMCFVFKSAVVFLCKERIRQKKKLMGGSSKSNHAEVEIIRYQVLIPVTEVQVRASTMKDVESHFMWELIHLKSQIQRRSEKVYHLSNSTSEFRNAFLKTIRQIIRESVRNMNIPVTKPLTKDKYGHYRKPGDSVSRTLSNKKKGQRGPQRHSSGNIDNDLETYDNVDFRSRGAKDHVDGGSAKDLSDSKSELIKDSQSDKSDKSDKDVSTKPTLGRTPNHLSLSTTSTLSTGSTGSTAAKLIQASNAPSNYTPSQSGKPLGSPVWKPRDAFSERPPMPGSTTKEHDGSRERYLVYEGKNLYMTPPQAKRERPISTSKHSD